jgi:hypothetical protein
MARPSKLSPEQWAEIERRLAASESASALAREFGVHASQITRRVTQVSQQVREVAEKVAIAQTALAELPVARQYSALSLADEIRGLQNDVLAATRLGAKSSLRLHAMANTELQKVDDAEPLKSQDALKGVAVLTKMANESMAPALAVLQASKDRLREDPPDPNAAPTSGVLVVPGLAADSASWAAQGGK